MLYVRKLFTQDLRDGKQIAFPKEPSLLFFAFDYQNNEEDRQITFTFRAGFNEFQEYEGKIIKTRLYTSGSESRMDGEVKAFVRDVLHANVNDLLIMKNKGTKHTEYEFMFVPQSNPIYDSIILLAGGENHSIYGFEHPEETKRSSDLPLQQIFYGAPGTGKSNTIKRDVEAKNNIHFRTTFHPDSDYSTFVGCYKPTTRPSYMMEGHGYNVDQLLEKFFDSKNEEKYKGAIKARYLFESLVNYQDIKNLGLNASEIASYLTARGFDKTAYTTEASCMYNIYNWLHDEGYLVDSKISYEFVPQAFTKAYCEAWNHYNSNGESEPVFLVIEEINRGNCAQIFGDIFQLLDRETEGARCGYSTYPIDADEDLKKFLLNGTKEDGSPWLINKRGIENGQICFPPNFHIWATMNTSDQSLFPIDSAFKRRWDWKYIPIEDHKDKNWKIAVGNQKYDWWEFLEAMNKRIYKATDSEDKKMGYFFVKLKGGETIISEDVMVNKVLFYLFNDVFKDFDSGDLFMSGNEKLHFSDYAQKDIRTKLLKDLMEIPLALKPENEKKDDNVVNDTPTQATLDL